MPDAKPNRALIDWFLVAIIISAVVGNFFPAQGLAILSVDWIAKIAIAALFFFYGVRLEPRQTIKGLKHWRLHSIILSFTFVLFPLIGISLKLLPTGIISDSLYPGLLFICLLPSTVQSSINFTSIAKGNIAAAIVSASISNLLGVFLTPVLAMWLMHTGGITISPASIIDIGAQILLPFILGQLSRSWTANWVNAHPKLKLLDQASIVIVVYKAFSHGARNNIWQAIGLADLLTICIFTALVLALMLWLTWQVSAWLSFNRADQIAIQFCGTKKSLATGVPMASVMFPAALVGPIVLPLMIFHQSQLMVCSALASRYARKDDAWHGQTNRKIKRPQRANDQHRWSL